MEETVRIALMLDPVAHKLAWDALAHANVKKHTLFASMRSTKVRQEDLDLGDAEVLLGALRLYADEVLREESPAYKIATELAAVLEDFSASQQRSGGVEDYQARESEPESIQDVHASQAADDFERRLQEKRDAIFRQIIGRPADLNIWGMPRQQASPSKRVPLNHAPPPTRTRDGDGELPARKRLTSIVDEEVAEALTQQQPVTYNEDMKREGAQELLDARRNHGANEVGTTIGHVTITGGDGSSAPTDITITAGAEKTQDDVDNEALARVTKAKLAGDTQAEIAALRCIWDQ